MKYMNIEDNSLVNEKESNKIFFYEGQNDTNVTKSEITNNDSSSTTLKSMSYYSKILDTPELKDSFTEYNKFINTENKFNPIRINFYLKNNLYDVPLNQGSKICNFPPIYKLDDVKFSYLYFNELITCPITITAFLSKKAKYNDSDGSIENKESKYEESLGIYFCQKIIKVENGKKELKCAPNEFICKYCMELNKKRYEIKSNYIINICGRVSKINKGSYHCFGHFLCGNQIEDCINKFSCKACKLIDEYNIY